MFRNIFRRVPTEGLRSFHDLLSQLVMNIMIIIIIVIICNFLITMSFCHHYYMLFYC